MTKTYCTAAVCYKKRTQIHTRKRECLHPKGPGKLESPRTPSTCPLTIKYTLTPENSFSFTIHQTKGDDPVNMVYYS